MFALTYSTEGMIHTYTHTYNTLPYVIAHMYVKRGQLCVSVFVNIVQGCLALRDDPGHCQT